MSKNITHEIIKPLAVLSVSVAFQKQVNLIRWNDGDPVIDIRVWDTERDKAQKGITIKAEELEALITALNAVKL